MLFYNNRTFFYFVPDTTRGPLHNMPIPSYNLLLLIFSVFGTTFKIPLIHSFLILSILVTPYIHLNICIMQSPFIPHLSKGYGAFIVSSQKPTLYTHKQSATFKDLKDLRILPKFPSSTHTMLNL
jgi:hypothetical protein